MRTPLVLATLGGALVFAAPAAALADAQVPPPPEPPPIDVHKAPPPPTEYVYRQELPKLSLLWTALQLVPSPELAFGRERHIDVAGDADPSINTRFGLRWQLTPFLWSFGVHREQTRWRSFVVDPVARQSGSIELSTSFEYIAGEINGLIVRPGVRVYLPVAQRGEFLSASLGTSVYRFDGFRVAYDVGAYFLSGFVGFLVTVAPAHAPLAAIATFRIRFF